MYNILPAILGEQSYFAKKFIPGNRDGASLYGKFFSLIAEILVFPIEPVHPII